LRLLFPERYSTRRLYSVSTGSTSWCAGHIEVAATLGVSHVTVSSWCKNYRKQGLKCLEDAPRSGRPIAIDGKQRAKITALACSDAPEGHARWNLRLLADKVIELGYCKKVSHTQVGKILKKTN